MKDTPAFPRSIYSLNGAIDSQSMSVGYGMTLRDYFAAKAMQGLLTIPAEELSNGLSDKYPRIDSYVSYLSFARAEMMEARTE